ncbi:hypothetical protein BMR09_08525, partial [Methylococcaceae bacterium CS3]
IRTARLFRACYEYAIDNDLPFDDAQFAGWKKRRIYDGQCSFVAEQLMLVAFLLLPTLWVCILWWKTLRYSTLRCIWLRLVRNQLLNSGFCPPTLK